MDIRPLTRREVEDIWQIDRSERIEATYAAVEGRFVRQPRRIDVGDWPPGEPERDGPALLDCFDHGGACFGVVDAGTVVAAAILEPRAIGPTGDWLQLKFLHVGSALRGKGLGSALFLEAENIAREWGARALYISATTSENTIRFYRARGCRLAEPVDPALFALEPEDIHLLYDITQ